MCGIFGTITINKITESKVNETLLNLRGPDNTQQYTFNDAFIKFYRLSINGLNHTDSQPFVTSSTDKSFYTMVNGEIYNYKSLAKTNGITLKTNNDCEIIHELFIKYNNIKLVTDELNSEHAIAILVHNHTTDTSKLFLSCDQFGKKPLYIGFNEESFSFSSTLESLNSFDYTNVTRVHNCNITVEKTFDLMTNKYIFNIITTKIEDISFKTSPAFDIYNNNVVQELTNAVKVRLMSDVSVGALLSGGLDSSLICALAQKNMDTKLRTFSVGIEGIESKDKEYALSVAKWIGSDHKHIDISQSDIKTNFNELLNYIETYDITTIRASLMQYSISKWIRQNTDIKVLLCGDGSDELFGGYLYFNNAPDVVSFQNEIIKLLTNIHYYDGLRADRCAGANSLEIRTPFLDINLVRHVTNIKLNHITLDKFKGIEKSLLRHAFKDTGLIPNDVIYRIKLAFSNSSADSSKTLVSLVQEYASYNELESYTTNFKKLYPNVQSNLICPSLWLPNWIDTNNEPSATVLPNYKEGVHSAFSE